MYNFVIYGGASELIQPLYKKYSDSNFISIIKDTRPQISKNVNLISTNDNDWKDDFNESLTSINNNNGLIYINAATYQLEKLFIAHSDEEISDLININIINNIYISKLIIGQMMVPKYGRLINLSSFRSTIISKGTSLYSSMKSFNNSLFKSFALEYGRFDITSNNIIIGFADTKLLDNLGSEIKHMYKSSIVKNKFLPNEEFINCIDYLIHSKYLNGSDIDITGGLKLLDYT